MRLPVASTPSDEFRPTRESLAQYSHTLSAPRDHRLGFLIWFSILIVFRIDSYKFDAIYDFREGANTLNLSKKMTTSIGFGNKR